MIMKCVDVVEERARDCKAAKDLRLTVKRIEEDKSFLVNEDKKMEIRQGFVEKKVKAAGAAAPAIDIDMQQLERDADAMVTGVQAATQNTIPDPQNMNPRPGSGSAASQTNHHRQERKQLADQAAAGRRQPRGQAVGVCPARVDAVRRCCCSTRV